jgi:hypothetical protein
MKTFVLILASVGCSSAFAVLDYAHLEKRDVPTTVVITENISIPIEYGTFEIPKGANAKILAIKTDGTLDIEYTTQKFSISATKTDFEKRVVESRSHRIVIDGVEYEDFKFSNQTPVNITITHRKGVETIALSKLPPELQKQFGYDPQKADEWVRAKAAAKLKAKQDKTRAELKAKFDSSIANWGKKYPHVPVIREINGKIYDFTAVIEFVKNQPENPASKKRSPFDCTVSGAVISVLKDGILVKQGAGLERYVESWARVGVTPADIPKHYQKVLFLKNHPSQATLVDGDRVGVMALPVGSFTYTTAAGAKATVRAYDFGTKAVWKEDVEVIPVPTNPE